MRNWVQFIAWIAGTVLCVKLLGSIIFEYRNYFPANFESHFLIGREVVFDVFYQIAFYSHILVGPVAIVIGWTLLFTGLRDWRPSLHRRMGRLQAVLVLSVLVPSGFVMAWDAHTGSIAAWGFGLQAAVTGGCLIVAVRHAVGRQFELHQLWAVRCFLLLISPFLLRLMIGLSIVGDFQTDTFYQFTAWASWMLPLAIYEAGRQWLSDESLSTRRFQRTVSLSENLVNK